jgi:hypothetical protein
MENLVINGIQIRWKRPTIPVHNQLKNMITSNEFTDGCDADQESPEFHKACAIWKNILELITENKEDNLNLENITFGELGEITKSFFELSQKTTRK